MPNEGEHIHWQSQTRKQGSAAQHDARADGVDGVHWGAHEVTEPALQQEASAR